MRKEAVEGADGEDLSVSEVAHCLRMVLKAADRGIISADRAVRTFFQGYLPERHGCGIKGQQGIGEQGSGSGYIFDGFGSLNRSQHSGNRTEHSGP